MYKSTPIPLLEGAAAQRFEQQVMQNESRRGSENYSEARAVLRTILDRLESKSWYIRPQAPTHTLHDIRFDSDAVINSPLTQHE